MTVAQLIQTLSRFEPSWEVIIQKDAEGNSYSPLYGADSALYLLETAYSGDLYMDDDEEAPKDATPCVVLWPMN